METIVRDFDGRPLTALVVEGDSPYGRRVRAHVTDVQWAELTRPLTDVELAAANRVRRRMGAPLLAA